MSSAPADTDGWLAMTPTGRPRRRPKPTTMFMAKPAWTSRKSLVIDSRTITLAHVVALLGVGGHDRLIQLGVGFDRQLIRQPRRVFQVVRRQEAEQSAAEVERLFVIFRR